MQAILDGLPIGNMPRRNLINTGHLLLNQNQPGNKKNIDFQ